jgi:hypothetical protein
LVNIKLIFFKIFFYYINFKNKKHYSKHFYATTVAMSVSFKCKLGPRFSMVFLGLAYMGHVERRARGCG